MTLGRCDIVSIIDYLCKTVVAILLLEINSQIMFMTLTALVFFKYQYSGNLRGFQTHHCLNLFVILATPTAWTLPVVRQAMKSKRIKMGEKTEWLEKL